MSLLSMMMSHERKKWICINQSQVSIQAVDQSEASIYLHEHLAAAAGGPQLGMSPISLFLWTVVAGLSWTLTVVSFVMTPVTPVILREQLNKTVS